MIKKVFIFFILTGTLICGVILVFYPTKTPPPPVVVSLTSTPPPPLSFFPKEVFQGEPLMIQVNASSSSVKRMTFGGVPVRIFQYKNKSTGLVGIDLNKITGIYSVVVELSDGSVVSDNIEIKEKKKNEISFSIPQKLGGDTVASQKNLVSTLAEENKIFSKLETGKEIFWSSGFISPLENVKVSDNFGYYRKIGNLIMAHKGVDYKAPEGTKVMSVNNGVVRVVGEYRNYGKVIVIDHGLGVMSFYLHLSEIKVEEGQLVEVGQVIGLSGQTGYAEGPHLHFSIRIYGVSVDPVKFLSLFQ